MHPDDANPEHLRVERNGDGYRMDIGICIGGNCGEGAEFCFDGDGEMIGDSPTSLKLY